MKLVNIFICPEFDLLQKRRYFTLDQKGVKRAKNNSMNYLLAVTKMHQAPDQLTIKCETIKD